MVMNDAYLNLNIPRYSSASIVHVPQLIQGMLEKSSLGPLADFIPQEFKDSKFSNIIHILIDGFGQKQWDDYKNTIRLMKAIESNGIVTAIDTVFPTSTPVALNSLYSNGQPPLQHGLIDWWMYDSDIDNIMITLPFCTMQDDRPGSLKGTLPPKTLYNGTSIFEVLSSKGIDVKSFISDKYSRSVYSSTTLKGSKVIAHNSAVDMMSHLSAAIASANSPTYLYGYWGDVDETGHTFGPNSPEHATATHDFFSALTNFIKNLDTVIAKKTLLLISADHGQIDVDPVQTIYLNDFHGFDNLLAVSDSGNTILPWGGAREIFIQASHPNEAYEFLCSHLGNVADIVFTDDAIKLGLFGISEHMHPKFKSRTGNLIILPRGKQMIWYKHPYGETMVDKGQHGGLSHNELTIPLALCGMDKLIESLSINATM